MVVHFQENHFDLENSDLKEDNLETQITRAIPEATPNIEATVDVRVEQERATNNTAVHSPNGRYTQNAGTGCIGS